MKKLIGQKEIAAEWDVSKRTVQRFLHDEHPGKFKPAMVTGEMPLFDRATFKKMTEQKRKDGERRRRRNHRNKVRAAMARRFGSISRKGGAL